MVARMLFLLNTSCNGIISAVVQVSNSLRVVTKDAQTVTD